MVGVIVCLGARIHNYHAISNIRPFGAVFG